MIRKTAIVITVLSFFLTAFGQELRSGEFVLQLNPDGAIGNSEQWGIRHLPTGNRMLGSAGIWVSAEDAQSRIYAAAHLKNRNRGSDFWAGPMDTFLIKAKNPSTWQKVWFNDRSSIQHHIQHWEEPDYIMPEGIKSWPANGVENTLGILAPFADANDNGIYEPEKGDYPFTRGEQSVYALFNDDYDEHTVSGAAPLKCGFFTEFWVSEEINNAFFMSYRLLNQSGQDYRKAILSLAAELDAGGTEDNLVAVDSLTGSIMLYNADQEDAVFNSSLPYVMITPVHFKPSGVMVLDSLGHSALPEKDSEFRNLQESFWADGSPLTYGRDGRDGEDVVKMMYTWPSWKDTSRSGYRFGLMNKQKEELEHGEAMELQVVISCGFADRPGPDAFRSEVLKQLQPLLLSENEFFMEVKPRLMCYPNPVPTGGVVHVRFMNITDNLHYSLTDLSGHVLMSDELQNGRFTLEDHIKTGLYVLTIYNNDVKSSMKLYAQ